MAWSIAIYAKPLEKRSRIELRMGAWKQSGESRQGTFVTPYLLETSVESNVPVIALSYGYWLQENLFVNFTLAVLAGQATARAGLGTSAQAWSLGVSQHAVGVLPILLGMRYYVPKPALETSVRPYLELAAGPCFGFEAKNEVGRQIVQQSRTMSAWGSHFGGGLDVQVGRNFMLGAYAGYNFQTDFSEPLGGRENYSGPELGVGISLLFGKGIE